MEFLPDSRAREAKGCIRSPHGNLIPIYCAQCGKPWGMVPEKHITFAFALCEPCSETMGPIAHTYQEPDAVFWKRVQEAQAEEEIDVSDVHALTRALSDPSNPLAKLAKDWQTHVLKTA